MKKKSTEKENATIEGNRDEVGKNKKSGGIAT